MQEQKMVQIVHSGVQHVGIRLLKQKILENYVQYLAVRSHSRTCLHLQSLDAGNGIRDKSSSDNSRSKYAELV